MSIIRKKYNISQRPRGFTLLEVLVAVFILSVGLLGIANLQMLGLTYNQNAYYRSQAIQLAYDITERMRMNQDGVDAAAYDNITLTSLPGEVDCNNSACDASQLASYDLYQWAVRIFGIDQNSNGNYSDSGDIYPALPNITGIVTTAKITNNGSKLFTIMLSWGEKEGADKTKTAEKDLLFAENFVQRSVEVYLQL